MTRTRQNRLARYTLLCEDGSGSPYDRPKSLFLNVPHELWTEGPPGSDRWYEVLSLPEVAFLVIALSNADSFPLPAERGPEYYRISADTLQRSVRGLRDRGLLHVERRRITAPLALRRRDVTIQGTDVQALDDPRRAQPELPRMGDDIEP